MLVSWLEMVSEAKLGVGESLRLTLWLYVQLSLRFGWYDELVVSRRGCIVYNL